MSLEMSLATNGLRALSERPKSRDLFLDHHLMSRQVPPHEGVATFAVYRSPTARGSVQNGPDDSMSHARTLRASLAILAVWLPAGGALAGPDTTTFGEVMRRVHEYVGVYEDHKLSTIMARERYHQQWLAANATIKGERRLLSDYLLLQLPDEDWVALRDVYDVDGEAVKDRATRLKDAFMGPREELGARAMRMAEDNATRFNLGDPYFRTMNLPTF